DSISHGANAPNIPRDSYMGVFKQSVAAAWKGANNYGFVSLLAVLDNKSGVYREMHSVSQSGDWEIDQSGEYLGAYAFKTSTPGADITINPTQSYKYTAIFYDQQPHGGDFDVVIGGNVVKTISTKGARNTSARTALIANANGGTERIQIITKNSKNVTITGVGYYNTTDGVVVNNYSRGGLQLTQISDDVIIKACKSSVVVIALGHNDMFFDTGAQFTQKINLIISEIKKNGSKLIVNDFTWGNPQGVNIKKELQRLATTCGGTFNDLTFAMRNDIQDGSHPTVRGHAILAKKLCENLKISCVK
ncbi:MAG: SGNH/GDSL hydrolase family protein, partial [Oscillospiraceae bacterium]